MRPLLAISLATGLSVGLATATAAAPLCADLVVEPVEPGVVRVLSDGAGHDLTDVGTFEDAKPVSLVSVGDDGSVWLTGRAGFIRLGTPGEIPDPLDTFLAQMEIGADGTLWIADGDHGASLGRWRDDSWTTFDLRPDASIVWLKAMPKGGIELAWRQASTLVFGSAPASGDGLTVAPDIPPLELGSLDGHIAVARTPDGRLWVAEDRWWQDEGRREPGRLWAFDGVAWQQAQPPWADPPGTPFEAVVDGMGRLWVLWWQIVPGSPGLGSSGHLARLGRDDTWTLFEGVDGGSLASDRDGVWLALDGWCRGYARFDDGIPVPYLDGLCVRPPSVSPAGEVWLFGHRSDRRDAGVYVIMPGAPGVRSRPVLACPDGGVRTPDD